MEISDDDLRDFETMRFAPMPQSKASGIVENIGAKIWYGRYGDGPAVILLHGGLGNSEDWFNQIPALMDAGFSVISIDSRGHGRSTRDERPFTYELMASDVLAVMNALNVARASVVGWSDGAIVALTLAMKNANRITRAFAFAGNMDPTGVKPGVPSDDPIIARIFARHKGDYARLSSTPLAFASFSKAVAHMMATEPNYTARDLAEIRTPVAIVSGDYDELLTLEHLEYLANTIPAAQRFILRGASHFAPLQRPALFNAAMLSFLKDV